MSPYSTRREDAPQEKPASRPSMCMRARKLAKCLTKYFDLIQSRFTRSEDVPQKKSASKASPLRRAEGFARHGLCFKNPSASDYHNITVKGDQVIQEIEAIDPWMGFEGDVLGSLVKEIETKDIEDDEVAAQAVEKQAGELKKKMQDHSLIAVQLTHSCEYISRFAIYKPEPSEVASQD